MNQPTLSNDDGAALAAVQKLPQAELAQVVAIASTDLANQISPAAEKSTPAKRAKASAKVVEEIAAATTPQKTAHVSKITKMNAHNAVVGQITVNGQQLDTLLSEGSFNKARGILERYAGEFGGERPYRMATRAENRAYVDSLLAKEEDNSIDAAEANALKTYRYRFVLDTEGGLVVDSRRVRDYSYWCGLDHPRSGALFVRASAESK